MFHYEKPWQDVRDRVLRALREAGRPEDGVRVLAVSKSFPPEAIRALHGLGQRAFGENYLQEAVAKMDALVDLSDMEWHLIGPLQSNKTGAAAERFDWVHTVDRERIADRLSAMRPPGKPPLNVCVQVNISGESTKSGVPPEDALALARAVAALPRLNLRGLMGIAEPTPVMASRRGQFRILKALFESCRAAGLPVDTLSMGMSDDLEAAIAEGATIVRIGTALFGQRTA
ncbi:MAG: YggS family pyridoxal phosphate-dependent enzyme [Casimicrobiaceae bacterium]